MIIRWNFTNYNQVLYLFDPSIITYTLSSLGAPSSNWIDSLELCSLDSPGVGSDKLGWTGRKRSRSLELCWSSSGFWSSANGDLSRPCWTGSTGSHIAFSVLWSSSESWLDSGRLFDEASVLSRLSRPDFCLGRRTIGSNETAGRRGTATKAADGNIAAARVDCSQTACTVVRQV